MLTGGSFDAGAADGEPSQLRVPVVNAPFLRVLLHVAESRFICHGGNGTGFEHMVAAEKGFRIFVDVYKRQFLLWWNFCAAAVRL